MIAYAMVLTNHYDRERVPLSRVPTSHSQPLIGLYGGSVETRFWLAFSYSV